MTTGRPIVTKCPKCRRGKHGCPPQELGVRGTELRRQGWRATRKGKVLRTLTHVMCVDCGHAWWTTLEPAPRSRA